MEIPKCRVRFTCERIQAAQIVIGPGMSRVQLKSLPKASLGGDRRLRLPLPVEVDPPVIPGIDTRGTRLDRPLEVSLRFLMLPYHPPGFERDLVRSGPQDVLLSTTIVESAEKEDRFRSACRDLEVMLVREGGPLGARAVRSRRASLADPAPWNKLRALEA